MVWLQETITLTEVVVFVNPFEDVEKEVNQYLNGLVTINSFIR